MDLWNTKSVGSREEQILAFSSLEILVQGAAAWVPPWSLSTLVRQRTRVSEGES